MVKEWTKLDSKLQHDYRIFQSRINTLRSPRTGKTHDFVVLDAVDWVNIIPVTPQGNVVLIYQYRYGTEAVSLEVPGGMVDPEDPDPAFSAQREMLEETGYDATQIIPLGSVEPNPAFMGNKCFSFLARDAQKVQEPQFDGAEDILTVEFPLNAVPELISNGRITHSLVVAAFYHLDNYKRIEAR